MFNKWVWLKPQTDALITLKYEGKYVFDIHPQVTKTEFKTWFEKTFNLSVIGMNTYRPIKKEKHKGRRTTHPVRYKTLILTLDIRQLLFRRNVVLRKKKILLLPAASSATNLPAESNVTDLPAESNVANLPAESNVIN